MSVFLSASPDHTFKCGDKHSFAMETRPQLYVQQTYFAATDAESHVLLGRGFRPLFIECWIQDATFTTRPLIDAYLLELDRLIGNKDASSGQLTITLGGVPQSYSDVYFVGFRRQPIPGQPLGVPIPNAFAGSGSAQAPAGNFWIPGILEFNQVLV